MAIHTTCIPHKVTIYGENKEVIWEGDINEFISMIVNAARNQKK